MAKAKGRPRQPGKKLVQVYVPDQTHARFKAWCALNDLDMSERIIAHMEHDARDLPAAKPKPSK